MTLSSPFTSGWLDARRTGLAEGAATLLSSHAEHPRPATSDTTNGGQAHPADSLKESQLAAGRDFLLGLGRHRPPESKQQASRRQRACGPRLRERGVEPATLG